jgi:DNA polymerase-1
MFGFDAVTAVDFEFRAVPGERPEPICMVATEVITGQTIQLFGAELRERRQPPYRTDDKALVVAFYASAEMSCHLALNWKLPANLLDLFTEFRVHTNSTGERPPASLLSAMKHFGLPGVAADEKDDMRQLAMRGGPYTASEAAALREYCASDVQGLVALLRRMGPRVDLDRALLRGRYMRAAASIEATGIPIDVQTLDRLRESWGRVREALVRDVDDGFHVYSGSAFNAGRFARWLNDHGVAWPLTPTGRLALDDVTFREQAKVHPQLAPLQQLWATLGQLRLADLAVGGDGRNRCMLSAFRSMTGRNQPSTTRFIFCPAVWTRGLIRPQEGSALAYIDWSQQEFGVAAALSEDPAMLAAYRSGDPYLAFGKQAGLIPVGGTKATHPRERELCKTTALGVQYGMREHTLGQRLGQSTAHGRELLRAHRRSYQRFWDWSDGVIDFAAVFGHLYTVYGWSLTVDEGFREASLRNFPMQANGAEMLRLACCRAVEGGVRICAPIHDAILIEAAADQIEEQVATAQRYMAQASADVLNGFELRSDAYVIRHPARYEDERGVEMWARIWRIIAVGT